MFICVLPLPCQPLPRHPSQLPATGLREYHFPHDWQNLAGASRAEISRAIPAKLHNKTFAFFHGLDAKESWALAFEEKFGSRLGDSRAHKPEIERLLRLFELESSGDEDFARFLRTKHAYKRDQWIRNGNQITATFQNAKNPLLLRTAFLAELATSTAIIGGALFDMTNETYRARGRTAAKNFLQDIFSPTGAHFACYQRLMADIWLSANLRALGFIFMRPL